MNTTEGRPPRITGRRRARPGTDPGPAIDVHGAPVSVRRIETTGNIETEGNRDVRPGTRRDARAG